MLPPHCPSGQTGSARVAGKKGWVAKAPAVFEPRG